MRKPIKTASSFYTLEIKAKGNIVTAPLLHPGDTIVYGQFSSPFGTCTLALAKYGICLLSFTKSLTDNTITRTLKHMVENAVITRDDQKVGAIGRTLFSEHPSKKPLTLVVQGTSFQAQVWSELCKIQSGRTASYKDIAKIIKRPHAYRAVGSACGKNRIGFLIPCHRILASDGTLGGFGWGLPLKEKMLAWEKMKE